MSNQVETMSDKTSRLFALYAELDAVNDVVKGIKEQISQIEYQLLTSMETEGLENIKTESGTVFIQSELYPSITDFSELLKYVYESGETGMIQKRISSKAFKEYFENEGAYPPGTDGTTGNKLGRRKAANR